ncbi:MAG: enoyl-CoA hydratase/isomerase family protein [Proteobacteria bacterium]|nr:enoyl-CoA hydratase/isomerase family protein [Pseudomonadota bacterium]
MSDKGYVTIKHDQGIATLSFFHPKKNSLTSSLLKEAKDGLLELSNNSEIKVIILRGDGDGPFCAGASFDELISLESEAEGKEFFSGFARLIIAMINSPKVIIGRIHGKAVGGGVGLTAASDYTFATQKSAIRLSELAVGIGPFVVGPVIEKKIGTAAYAEAAIDTKWKTADWAHSRGLLNHIAESEQAMDDEIAALASRLSKSNPEALEQIKQIMWTGTEHWPELLEQRAAMSGRMVLSDFTSHSISKFKAR